MPATFTADELREIEAFYRGPTGQKLLQNSQAITEQVAQVGRDGGGKAADDLRARLTEALRQKGYKLLSLLHLSKGEVGLRSDPVRG